MLDEAYLDQVAGIVAWCRAAGVDVLLDLHEDGWSKELCEDGAPLVGDRAAAGGADRRPGAGPRLPRLRPAALAAFDSFWADADGLQERLPRDARRRSPRASRADPAVIGYEIMNEPIGVDDTVQAFQARAAQALRDADAKKLVVFEPVGDAQLHQRRAHRLGALPRRRRGLRRARLHRHLRRQRARSATAPTRRCWPGSIARRARRGRRLGHAAHGHRVRPRLDDRRKGRPGSATPTTTSTPSAPRPRGGCGRIPSPGGWGLFEPARRRQLCGAPVR